MLIKTKTLKKILILILTIYPIFIFGQSTNKYEIGVSLNTMEPSYPLGGLSLDNGYGLDGGNHFIKSFAIGLTGKYFFKDPFAFRLRVIYNYKNEKNNRVIMPVIDNYNFTQTLIKISPGIQRTYLINKFSFFGGLELPFTIIGKMKEYSSSTHYPELSGFVSNNNIPGGYSIGLGLFLGSNYYFFQHFAIGFDLGTAYQYSNVGGTLSSTSIYTSISGTTKIHYQSEERVKEFKFSNIQAGINLIVRL
jgi:hypothetical protein